MDPFVAKDRTEEEEEEVDEEEDEGMTRGLTFNEVLHLLTRKAVMGPVSEFLYQSLDSFQFHLFKILSVK